MNLKENNSYRGVDMSQDLPIDKFMDQFSARFGRYFALALGIGSVGSMSHYATIFATECRSSEVAQLPGDINILSEKEWDKSINSQEYEEIPPVYVNAIQKKNEVSIQILHTDFPNGYTVEILQVPIETLVIAGSDVDDKMGRASQKYDSDTNTWKEIRDITEGLQHYTNILRINWDESVVVGSGKGFHDLPNLSKDKTYVIALIKDNKFSPYADEARFQIYTPSLGINPSSDEDPFTTIIDF